MSKPTQPAASTSPLQARIAELHSDKVKAGIQNSLPNHMKPNVEKFIRVLEAALRADPKLAGAPGDSFYAAVGKCAVDGLLPDGREAVLVVLENRKTGIPTVNYWPMMAGILKKVRNSGELSSIYPQVVYEKDQFERWIDENGEHMKHVPTTATERGNITHAYCIAKTKDGGTYIEVMTRAEVEQIRQGSRAANSGPWTTWWGEMAKKTVTRRLSKRLPMSTDLEGALTADDDLYDLGKGAAPAPEQKPQAEPGTSSRLRSHVTKGKDKPAPSAPAQTEGEPEHDEEEIPQEETAGVPL